MKREFPKSADAQFEHALDLVERHCVPEAIECLRKAVAEAPEFHECRRKLADLLLGTNNFASAAEQYAALFVSNPNDAALFQRFGFCCQQTHQFAYAEKAYTKALALGIDSAELRFNLGLVIFKQGRARNAIEHFKAALALNSSLPMAHFAIGNAYRELGDLVRACAAFREELQICPGCAEAAVNLGAILQELLQVSEAIACYREALLHHPDHGALHWNLAMTSLLSGDYKTGWTEYEWRWLNGSRSKPRFIQPEWRGEDLAGRTLLLYSEQGIGDTLMFARFVRRLETGNGKVIVQCQPHLQALIETIPGVSRSIVAGEPFHEFDCHAPLLSLPYLLNLEDDFGTCPYLHPPQPGRLNYPFHRASIRVGLVWAGNPNNPNDRIRSLHLRQLQPIWSGTKASFYSLQVGAAASQCREIETGHQLIDLSQHLSDWSATAEAVAQMDLIISVDTAVAHLAGALARQVWLLAPYSPDWRWGLESNQTPWYPSMKLFRQPRPGDWTTPIATIAEELRDRIL